MEQADKNAKSFKGTEATVRKISFSQRKRGRTTTRPTNDVSTRITRPLIAASLMPPATFVGRRDTSLPSVAQRKADKDNQMGKTKYMSDATEDKCNSDTATEENYRPNTESEEKYFIDRLGSKSTRPIVIDLKIAGRNHQMELDTGSILDHLRMYT